jgi:hypothetical protein
MPVDIACLVRCGLFDRLVVFCEPERLDAVPQVLRSPTVCDELLHLGVRSSVAVAIGG